MALRQVHSGFPIAANCVRSFFSLTVALGDTKSQGACSFPPAQASEAGCGGTGRCGSVGRRLQDLGHGCHAHGSIAWILKKRAQPVNHEKVL